MFEQIWANSCNTNLPTDRLTNWRTDQSADRLINWRTNPPTHWQTNRQTNGWMDRLTNRPTDRPMEQPTDQQRPTNQPTSGPTSQPACLPTYLKKSRINSIEKKRKWEKYKTKDSPNCIYPIPCFCHCYLKRVSCLSQTFSKNSNPR